ncbi:hypothetical protein ACIQC8_06200 [Agrococcus sediminis]|uniref:hypothetical protein n=1 Tax=Agrococcus sediminis TaxID=2599924 RepID=UPI00380E7FFD
MDQIGPRGQLLSDFDTRMPNRKKDDLLLAALPGATVQEYGGEKVVRFRDQIILKKQVTHLGIPWPPHKKRIQIPPRWLDVHRRAQAEGLTARFVGIYHYAGVTVFVDFDPKTYVNGKANNSAAHVATNDLYQAQTLGIFSRDDRNGNHLTSVNFAEFADYLAGTKRDHHPRLDVFSKFNDEFLTGHRVEALAAIQQMHEDSWPDRFQGEWPGFFLEYRFDEFVRRHHFQQLVAFQKVKSAGAPDFDLVFRHLDKPDYYGDLKASSIHSRDSPGNDAVAIRRAVERFGRFWYVIYEHETWHGKSEGDAPTIAWNEWRRSVGYESRKPYNALSYASRFKAAVSFRRMSVLEVNEANFHIVLADFNQGQQPGGGQRAPKVMISKRYIDNFLIFEDAVD